MSGNIDEERVNHLRVIKIIVPVSGVTWLADNLKCYKRKFVALQSFSSAKCKMLKHRNNEWGNPPKNIVLLKKKRKKKIDICIFNRTNLNWLKDYVKCLGRRTHPDSHYQRTYFFPSLPPKFSCFPAEKYSIPILIRIRNENSEYNWYRSIDFYYKCTWSLGFKKFKINTLYSVCQYKANCFTN